MPGRWTLVSVLLAVVLVSGPPPTGATLPDLDVVLTVEIRDPTAWLAMHEAVLGSSRDTPLTVSVDAPTAGRRAIIVHQPRFDTHISLLSGVRPLEVMIVGKLSGIEALTTVTAFKSAVLAIQSGRLENSLTLTYGLAALGVQLIEMRLSRP